MKALFSEPYNFDFFQAVWLLEHINSDREPIGRDAVPQQEAVRFVCRQSLAFPASEIQECIRGEIEEEGESSRSPQPTMTVNFMGLTGPSGVLPHYYTELLLERMRQKDLTARDFLDLFNHRLISFFHRAWEKYHFPVGYRREGHGFSQYLAALAGIGTPGLENRTAVSDEAIWYYAGLFNKRARSASALAGLLCDYFEVPVEVEQFIGRWVTLGSENETRLGVQNSRLGVNVVCGSRIWDRQSKFRIRVGPLRLATFKRFLPAGPGHRELMDLARFFAGPEFDFDVQLVLRAEEIPACELRTDKKDGPRLGWSSWLKVKQPVRDSEETILRSES